jgi:hypothetical protein
MRRALESQSALRWSRQQLSANQLSSLIPSAFVIGLFSSDDSRLHIGSIFLISTICSLIVLIGGIIRYVLRIIRELTIRGVIRKVSDEKLPAATGKEFVDMLTKLPDVDPAIQNSPAPEARHPNPAQLP